MVNSMNKDIKILIFVPYYLPGFKGGGPIKTIKNLMNEIGDEISFKLLTSDRDFGDNLPYDSVNCGDWNKLGHAEVFYIQPCFTGYKQIFNVISEKGYDVIYLNSFFSIRFSLFPILMAKYFNKKVILGPRGEFSEGALSLKARKKQIFIKLYRVLRLYQSTVFQASSDYEAQDIRNVLGTKIDIQIAEDIGAQEFVESMPVRNIRRLHIVFVSRISPMKNLLTALEILKTVKQSVSYDIYGPIEDDEYWAKCKAVISTLPENIQVEYKGELYPNEVVSTLSKYDAFFMPTKGENYGHVIAEALCAALPLLISDATPWRNLQEQGIGWDLPLNKPEAFVAAINQLVTMPTEEHHQMRESVLAWAKDKFSQRDAIEANIAMFNYTFKKRY